MEALRWDASHITTSRSAVHILIFLLISFLLYIIVGSIVLTKFFNAEGIDRIPHLTFWMSYPGLVLDGLNYIRHSIGCFSNEKFTQTSNYSTKFAPGRDTFSQFDPI